MSKNMKVLQHLKNGIAIGLAGGVAEVAVVWSYAAATGADAAAVADGIARAVHIHNVGLHEAFSGIMVHMLLATALGIILYTVFRTLPRWAQSFRAFPFMLVSLACVWAINFLVVLPSISPTFVHLMPYSLTLASKLFFGAAGATTLWLQNSGSFLRLATLVARATRFRMSGSRRACSPQHIV